MYNIVDSCCFRLKRQLVQCVVYLVVYKLFNCLKAHTSWWSSMHLILVAILHHHTYMSLIHFTIFCFSYLFFLFIFSFIMSFNSFFFFERLFCFFFTSSHSLPPERLDLIRSFLIFFIQAAASAQEVRTPPQVLCLCNCCCSTAATVLLFFKDVRAPPTD